MKILKWQIKYNGMPTGKKYLTKKECKKAFNQLLSKGLYGYTISKI